MAAHLTEEEQIEALKRWWNDNGRTITIAIVVALLGFWGWNQYQGHKAKVAEENSIEFQQLIDAINAEDESAKSEGHDAELTQLAKLLHDSQSDSLYGNFAELFLAKQAVDNGKLDEAEQSLQVVINEPANSAVKELATLRLARVKFAKGDAGGALNLLNAKVSDAFASVYEEVKGDIYFSQDKLADAGKTYQMALESLEPTDFMRRNLLQLKLDNTKIASDVPDITPKDSVENPHGVTTKAGDA